jgi:hypothetical protein
MFSGSQQSTEANFRDAEFNVALRKLMVGAIA